MRHFERDLRGAEMFYVALTWPFLPSFTSLCLFTISMDFPEAEQTLI